MRLQKLRVGRYFEVILFWIFLFFIGQDLGQEIQYFRQKKDRNVFYNGNQEFIQLFDGWRRELEVGFSGRIFRVMFLKWLLGYFYDFFYNQEGRELGVFRDFGVRKLRLQLCFRDQDSGSLWLRELFFDIFKVGVRFILWKIFFFYIFLLVENS